MERNEGIHADEVNVENRLQEEDSRSSSEHSLSSDTVLPLIDGEPEPGPEKPIGWLDLPRKDQLIILTIARLSEPLVQTSLQAYIFYQLKWFDPSLPDSTISVQASILHASFTAAQLLTAMLWGRVADSIHVGRKTVLLIGLIGTSISSLGFGFATSYWQALVLRLLGGATNGNIGVMRTMISEIVQEKKFQSRAFLLLPMTFNIGIIVGPILGGILSDPAGSYPDIFGKIPFFVKFPYAAPNIVSTIFLAIAAAVIWLGLEETHDARRDRPDLGLRLGRSLAAFYTRWASKANRDYTLLTNSVDIEDISTNEEAVAKLPVKRYTQKLPFRRIFTRNVILTFSAQFLLMLHLGTFNSLFTIFLSTSVYDPDKSKDTIHLPFRFTGGLGLAPRDVGIALAIIGCIGIIMQLFLYPRISARLGNIKSWRWSLLCFPVAFFLVPYLSIVPSSTEPPAAKSGLLMWLAMCGVLFIQVTGRTFALPSQIILINNATPHPSVLGTIHGIGQSVGSAGRTFGPVIGGFIYGFGLNHNMVGLLFWLASGVGVCACFASLLVSEGDGHEIWLDGDQVEEEPPIRAEELRRY